MFPTNSPNLVSAEQILSEMRRNMQDADGKTLAVIMEAHQVYMDHLDFAQENIHFDTSVVIDVDGKRIRFPNEKALADFLSEKMT